MDQLSKSTSQSVQLFEIYRFLAQAMRYPEEHWFNNDFLSIYAILLDDLDWQTKDQFVSDFTYQYLEDLQVEYTRLFITGVPHVIAPPYASVYIDDTLNGPTTSRTEQYYLKHGFVINNNDFPDHIVTELDFAAVLEENKAGSSENFLVELFCPWFAQFKTKVMQDSKTNYYLTTILLIDFFTLPERED